MYVIPTAVFAMMVGMGLAFAAPAMGYMLIKGLPTKEEK